MADNTIINPGSGGDAIATDDIGGIKFQRVKPAWGVDGVATDVSAAAPLPVDTELPAAAALSDATANPTAPMAGAAGMVWDAAALVWKRAAQVRATWDTQPYTGVAAVMAMLAQDDSILRPQKHSGGLADGEPGTFHGASSPRLYNGLSFDRQRGNTEGTLLASAARTGFALSAVQTNYNARSVVLVLDVTAVGTGQAYMYFYSSASAASGTGLVNTTTPAISGTGTYYYEYGPGCTSTDVTNATGRVVHRAAVSVPRVWLAGVGKSDGSSWTCSLTALLGV